MYACMLIMTLSDAVKIQENELVREREHIMVGSKCLVMGLRT
jgi:hypothetical protein